MLYHVIIMLYYVMLYIVICKVLSLKPGRGPRAAEEAAHAIRGCSNSHGAELRRSQLRGSQATAIRWFQGPAIAVYSGEQLSLSLSRCFLVLFAPEFN